MARNYSNYSSKRRAITQQVRRLEARGYTVPERYHLPTVAELKKMSPKDQNNIMRRAKGYTPEKVRSASKMNVTETTKKGNIITKAISYVKARVLERKRAAEKAIRTRKATKIAREEYGLPKGYVVDPDTGAVRPTRAKKSRGSSYAPPSESEPEQSNTYTDKNGNVFDTETGELIEEGSVTNVETLSNTIDPEEYELYQEMRDEGIVDEGTSFEEWKATLPEKPSGGDYVDQMEAFLQANGDNESADLLDEIYKRYSGANRKEFEERMEGDNLPDLGDFYYQDSTGSVHYDVNAYIKLLERMKGGPLSARESRKLSEALKNG